MSFISSLFNSATSLFQKKEKSIQDLLNATPPDYRQRAQKLFNGHIEYYGYRYKIKQMRLMDKINLFIKKLFNKPTVNTVTLELHFKVRSADDRKSSTYYHLVVEFPYMRKMTGMDMLKLPVKIYCGCDSFKYTLAYTVLKNNNLFVNDQIKSKLGIALTQRPKIRNPREVEFFCKHLYAVISTLKSRRIGDFLGESKEIKN